MSIQTQRLELKLMSANFMLALLDDDYERASSAIGYQVPEDWELAGAILEMRLKKLSQDANLEDWQIRVMALKESGKIIGHTGFHTSPGPAYLARLSPGGVELGYTVFEQYRRKGYASEAVMGMIEWARRDHGVKRFIVSIDPDNEPSLGLARKLGFVYLETLIDDEDGPEEIMELVVGSG